MWSGSPALSYQWLRNGAAIAGATGREYVPVARSDEGQGAPVPGDRDERRRQLCRREPRRRRSLPEPSPLPPVAAAEHRGAERYRVGGQPADVQPERAPWTGGPAFTYRWLRGGATIAGANAASYTLASEDEGKVIQCQVTGNNAGGTVIADSAAVVASPAPSRRRRCRGQRCRASCSWVNRNARRARTEDAARRQAVPAVPAGPGPDATA